MDRRKFTKNVTKIISTGVLLSSNQLITGCSEDDEVLPDGTLQFTIPEDRDLIAGETFEITWKSVGIEKLDLAYKIDQAANFLTFERDYPANNLKYDFLVPNNINGLSLTFRVTNSETEEVLAEGNALQLIFKFLINLTETPELLLVGGALKVEEGVNNPFIVRKVGEEAFIALSRVCTHQGCVIDVNEDASFSCPCHGSEFTKDGEVTNGPAERALSSFKIEKEGNALTVFYF
ncbi:MAG: Rieske (2Fe-2S) protein [Bacteroidota bacterium]